MESPLLPSASKVLYSLSLEVPNTSGLPQQQTSYHLFAPAVRGNVALTEGSSLYNSSAKMW